MAVRTKAEILEVLQNRIGENSDDETLSFIEDITDTINDYEEKVSGATNWKQKYEENDAEWRAKYRDRFFSGEVGDDAGEPEDTDEGYKPTKFEDLFTKE